MCQQKIPEKEERKIKCLVWDLDNTVWDGVLSENEDVSLRKGAVYVIKTLDKRGILQSIASKNDHSQAVAKLNELGIKDYFIYPQINWGSKSQSVRTIAKSINIGIDTIAFIDDQPFELEEVSFSHPQVLCIDAADMSKISDMSEFMPKFITDESKIRRAMYMSDIERNNIEERFEGPKEEFLASLNMVFKISQPEEEDLKRAEELTVRTHQLNTTGYTYSYEDLDRFRKSENHILYVASLDDKYGTYGKIGLLLIETSGNIWTIKLLLMSCRVMARGVGSIMINHIRNQARDAGVSLRAEFLPTDVNRMMYMTYKFTNFSEKEKTGDILILENDLTQKQEFPGYVKIEIS
jgi:FkbH-like protein